MTIKQLIKSFEGKTKKQIIEILVKEREYVMESNKEHIQ